MSTKKTPMSEEDYLKRHLQDLDHSQNIQNGGQSDDLPFVEQPQTARTSDLQYFNMDIRELPCGNYYPTGTLFMIRPAQVREIQAYSMVDDTNFYDIVEKMNDMLQACVRVKYPDGKIASYLEIKDQDRLFLIFLIRELTFQQGNALAVTAKCSCGQEVKIELNRKNFVFHEQDSKLEKYFSLSSRTYNFSTVNGKYFELAPPNIGLQKAFTDYIIKENQEKRTPNLSFLKIIPFMLPGRASITYDGIKAKLKEFEEIDDISFQFLNAAVNKMTIGISEIKSVCECGEEVRTDMQFPDGASGVFVISDAFDAFIKE
jgi:hypothetical protein